MHSSQPERSLRSSVGEDMRSRRYTMGPAVPVPITPQKRPFPSTPISKKSQRMSLATMRQERAEFNAEWDDAERHGSQSHVLQSRRASSLNPRTQPTPFIAEAFNSGKTRSVTKLHSDPRPIKDPEYQRSAIKTIIDYLSRVGYANVTRSTLRGLASKDFQNIFRFLHLRLEPEYVYGKKKFEDEVLEVLKSLRYPLADTIGTKAFYSIAAPHSYPSFLALLLWMTESCELMDRIENEDSLQEEDFELTSKLDPDQMDMLYSDYALATYRMFMDGMDEYDEVDLELAKIFEAINQGNRAHIQDANKDERQLQERYDELKDRISPMEGLRDRFQEMEKDMVKLEEFCHEKERKIEKYTETNKTVKAQIKLLEDQNTVYKRDRDHINADLVARNISGEEIEFLDNENLRLEREMEAIRNRSEEIQKTTWTKEMEVKELQKEIYTGVHHFGEFASRLEMTPPSAANAMGTDFTLVFHPDATRPEELVSIDLAGLAMPHVQALEGRYSQLLTQIKREVTQLETNLHGLEERVEELQKEEEMVSTAVKEKERQVKSVRENSMQELSAHNKAMDELERNRKELLNSIQDQLIACGQQKERLRVKLSQITLSSNAGYTQMHQMLTALFDRIQTTLAHFHRQADELREWSVTQSEKGMVE